MEVSERAEFREVFLGKLRICEIVLAWRVFNFIHTLRRCKAMPKIEIAANKTWKTVQTEHTKLWKRAWENGKYIFKKKEIWRRHLSLTAYSSAVVGSPCSHGSDVLLQSLSFNGLITWLHEFCKRGTFCVAASIHLQHLTNESLLFDLMNSASASTWISACFQRKFSRENMTKASGLINQRSALSSQMFVLPSKTTSNANYMSLVVVYLLD